MAGVTSHVQSAMVHCANEHQRNMLEAYAAHFRTGDVEKHIASQRHWVDDKGPVVEVQLGFIEPYRDPAAVRGEWQGTVAIVNKETSRRFAGLVQAAEGLLA